jgi:hypothetical protein
VDMLGKSWRKRGFGLCAGSGREMGLGRIVVSTGQRQETGAKSSLHESLETSELSGKNHAGKI